ncbi:sensory transduction histidine kinase [Hydrogenimonas sp.]|nr:sensory transduction histidine kinase [Hydrogenimonas sp.]
MIRFFLISLFLNQFLSGAVTIDRDRIDLLPYCEFLTLKDSHYSFEDVAKIPNSRWKKSDKKALSLGFSNNTTLWVKCTLENPFDKSITRILETDNPRTEFVTLYADHKKILSGSTYRGVTLDAINPYFKLRWKPKEAKTIFLSFKSYLFPLNARPVLWKPSSYAKHEKLRHLFLGIFFGVMGALLIYNFFIMIFTKDITYFWYCGYLAGMILYQLYYTRVLELYILHTPIKSALILNVLIAASLVFIPYFTRYFLNTSKTMPLVDKVLKFLPIYVLFVTFTQPPKISLMFLLVYAPIFIYISIKALAMRLQGSKYYAAGWLSVTSAMLIITLINFGYLPSIANSAFIPQAGFAFEALIFSIGLADRINTLKAEKEAADRELIDYHKEEQYRLQKMVERRTKALTKALEEKNILLKEIHHRVKNNLQMIVSLLQLQSSRIADEKILNIVSSAQSRIDSIGKLHELLYRNSKTLQIETEVYFRLIVEKLISNFQAENIESRYDIEAELDADRAIYCGLIINELVTNSLKYAFDAKEGKISISFKREGGRYLLSVADNGIGMGESIDGDSIGLTLVKALASKQLKGSFKVYSNGGTRVEIRFPA